jgi:predicted PurR-regulated permease PerM
LTAWGAIAIGLVDNFLYPFLVGKQLRFHTLLVFFAMVGGLYLFGASGVILGPLLLSLSDALLRVWRRRTAFGGTVDAAAQPST